jgi:hypothetical protein
MFERAAMGQHESVGEKVVEKKIVSLNLIQRRSTLLRSTLCTLLTAVFVVSAGLVWSSRTSAQKVERVRVADSILGIRLGVTLEEAREKLKGLGSKAGGAGEGAEEGEREGGRKEAWMLKKSAYTSIAYQADNAGRIQWVTGFVRRGKEIPFSKFGDLTRAAYKSDQEAVWNVQRAEGNFRVIAKGTGGKASVVHLLKLQVPPVP